MANLVILPSSAGVTHIPKIPGHEVRVVAIKAMAFKAMVRVMGRPAVRPMT